MPRLAAIIRAHHHEILERWTREAQRVAAARGLTRPEFQNIFPTYLHALAEAGVELGRFSGERRAAVESHLSARLRQGFPVAEIVEEFALLGRAIAATWNGDGRVAPPTRGEIEDLFAELHLSSVAVAELFTRHMLDDEQAEKQFLRLIRTVAQEALKPGAPDLRARLEEVLGLVVEAIGARCAMLLLDQTGTPRLELSATVGIAEREHDRLVDALNSASFAGEVAAHDGATMLTDAAISELDDGGALKRCGVRSLLGVRLRPGHQLLGVLYVGLAEKRAFTPREVGRLESLGEQLSLHLDNARLYSELREHVAMLQDERALREQFVSVLAHDLRGPLSAAKVGSQLLARDPGLLGQRRELAGRIDRSIDRADRMIRDLLDANLIRAGQRLPLHLEACDLTAVLREVCEELTAGYGERFRVDAEAGVGGFWSAEELRRAVWNLAANAVKYGAPESPITVAARRAGGEARVSVHNEGLPLSKEDLHGLFRPFARAPAAVAGGQRGWGLGLTLVKACAEAHGGHVEVDSSRDAGTTFTLVLPLDARPFQVGPAEPEPQAPPTLH